MMPGEVILNAPVANFLCDTNYVLLLDKPPGLSSNAALQRLRWLLGKPKAGHTGTLDPLATGMLPVCIGEATKFAGYLLSSKKRYRATVRLGIETASGDRDAAIVREASVPALDKACVQNILATFIGCIHQRPPMYSALKKNGVPLYVLARKGETVEIPEREVTIHALELIRFDHDELDIEVECGSGTYIRSLGMDIARALGTIGHLSALRRLWVSPFEHIPMASLADIEAWRATPRLTSVPWCVTIDKALALLPKLSLSKQEKLSICQGKAISTTIPADSIIRLFDQDGIFFGLGETIQPGILHAKRLLSTGGKSA